MHSDESAKSTRKSTWVFPTLIEDEDEGNHDEKRKHQEVKPGSEIGVHSHCNVILTNPETSEPDNIPCQDVVVPSTNKNGSFGPDKNYEEGSIAENRRHSFFLAVFIATISLLVTGITAYDSYRQMTMLQTVVKTLEGIRQESSLSKIGHLNQPAFVLLVTKGAFNFSQEFDATFIPLDIGDEISITEQSSHLDVIPVIVGNVTRKALCHSPTSNILRATADSFARRMKAVRARTWQILHNFLGEPVSMYDDISVDPEKIKAALFAVLRKGKDALVESAKIIGVSSWHFLQEHASKYDDISVDPEKLKAAFFVLVRNTKDILVNFTSDTKGLKESYCVAVRCGKDALARLLFDPNKVKVACLSALKDVRGTLDHQVQRFHEHMQMVNIALGAIDIPAGL